MNVTDIAWCDFSANPLKYRRKSDNQLVWACVKTSPGCANCYSERIALRFERGKLFTAGNMEELEPFMDMKELKEILSRNKCGGRRVDGGRCFVGDMTDLFGEWVDDVQLDIIFSAFARRPRVTFQILTSCAERMRDYMLRVGADVKLRWGTEGHYFGDDELKFPLPNVWLGISAENHEHAMARDTFLQQTPAAVRFWSVEPQLDVVSLWAWCPYCKRHLRSASPSCGTCHSATQLPDWIIIGGESGTGARPFVMDWAVHLIKQCRAAEVPVFMKQVGSNPCLDIGTSAKKIKTSQWGPITSTHGAIMSEWPLDLRVQQFPKAKVTV